MTDDAASEAEEHSPPTAPWQPTAPPSVRRPRRSLFSLEGRAAPALYLIAWLLTIPGLVVVLAVVMSGGGLHPNAATTIVAEAGLVAAGGGLVAGAGSQALQRRADGDASFAPSPFLGFAAQYFVVLAIALPVVSLIRVAGVALSEAALLVVSLSISLVVYFALIKLLVVGTHALTWGEIIRPSRFPSEKPEPPPNWPGTWASPPPYRFSNTAAPWPGWPYAGWDGSARGRWLPSPPAPVWGQPPQGWGRQQPDWGQQSGQVWGQPSEGSGEQQAGWAAPGWSPSPRTPWGQPQPAPDRAHEPADPQQQRDRVEPQQGPAQPQPGTEQPSGTQPPQPGSQAGAAASSPWQQPPPSAPWPPAAAPNASPGRWAPAARDAMQSAGPYQPGVPSFTPPLGAASGRRIRLPQSRQRGLVVDVLLALGLLVPVFFVTGYFTQILVYFLHLQASEVPQSIPTSLSTIDRALVFVAAAILAPIGEEFFFRGYATNAWARRLPWVRAFLQSALFFAFVHIIDVTGADASIALRAAILAFGARVPVSFALTWLYLHQHSIFASLTLHAAYNGLLVLISFSLLAT